MPQNVLVPTSTTSPSTPSPRPRRSPRYRPLRAGRRVSSLRRREHPALAARPRARRGSRRPGAHRRQTDRVGQPHRGHPLPPRVTGASLIRSLGAAAAWGGPAGRIRHRPLDPIERPEHRPHRASPSRCGWSAAAHVSCRVVGGWWPAPPSPSRPGTSPGRRSGPMTAGSSGCTASSRSRAGSAALTCSSTAPSRSPGSPGLCVSAPTPQATGRLAASTVASGPRWRQWPFAQTVSDTHLTEMGAEPMGQTHPTVGKLAALQGTARWWADLSQADDVSPGLGPNLAGPTLLSGLRAAASCPRWGVGLGFYAMSKPDPPDVGSSPKSPPTISS